MTPHTTQDAGRARRAQFVRLVQARGAVAILVLVCLIAGRVFPHFLSAPNLLDIVAAAAFVALITIGQSFVIILGGFDLSVGSLVGLGTVIAAYAAPYGWGAALAAPVCVGLIVGLMNGWLIARARMAPFIVTLAALLGLKGLSLVLASQDMLIANPGLFATIANGSLFGVGHLVWIVLVAYLVAAFVLNHTRYGAGVFAIGGNEEAARMLGVHVEGLKIVTYGLSNRLPSQAR
ncbi:ABC transporter permease [Burkholderia cenocepacia]|uniref:ABC transporter permease n=2 Tax=Burkholderia cenocepacia TaxID=95486 RepID=UPI001F4B7683|nr:ABC transporter permease [Burkholderia cenocepacia]MDC6086304.1 ABC transporter permease [Burkholderia cenocepacia]